MTNLFDLIHILMSLFLTLTLRKMTQNVSPASNIPSYKHVLGVIKMFAVVDNTKVYQIQSWAVNLGKQVVSYGNIWNAILRLDDHARNSSQTCT